MIMYQHTLLFFSSYLHKATKYANQACCAIYQAAAHNLICCSGIAASDTSCTGGTSDIDFVNSSMK